VGYGLASPTRCVNGKTGWYEQRSGSIDKALLKRRCTTDDLAEVMLFLLAGAAMVTGQTITVDGGLTLG
jgi:3-oxoacyl-[acyl-carrier protein] reductase